MKENPRWHSSTREYPNDLTQNEIYVDLAGQVVFAPINGCPIPFHISMIKNVVLPDPDRTATSDYESYLVFLWAYPNSFSCKVPSFEFILARSIICEGGCNDHWKHD